MVGYFVIYKRRKRTDFGLVRTLGEFAASGQQSGRHIHIGDLSLLKETKSEESLC